MLSEKLVNPISNKTFQAKTQNTLEDITEAYAILLNLADALEMIDVDAKRELIFAADCIRQAGKAIYKSRALYENRHMI